jgi:hypothetical protein
LKQKRAAELVDQFEKHLILEQRWQKPAGWILSFALQEKAGAVIEDKK